MSKRRKARFAVGLVLVILTLVTFTSVVLAGPDDYILGYSATQVTKGR